MTGRSPALNEEVFARDAGSSAEVMTIPDVVRACIALLSILIITGALGWYWIGDPGTAVSVPVWFYAALIAALIIGIVTVFKPNVAPFTAPTSSCSASWRRSEATEPRRRRIPREGRMSRA